MAASVPFSFFLLDFSYVCPEPFHTKNVHVYQDRLGTNIGKAALKKRMMRL
eukprot:COSAG06_NODE_71112_length_187_cov_106.522727_1_plen_50_part_01